MPRRTQLVTTILGTAEDVRDRTEAEIAPPPAATMTAVMGRIGRLDIDVIS